MAHSFYKYWSRQGLNEEPEGKSAGRPGWDWTPSRERQLFRLVAKGNVPWKHIAVAMYEPAASGENEFAPCKEACRNHWQKMTDMKPRETYIKNQFRRQKQREQLECAFERFQQRQSQSTSVAPVISQVVQPESSSILAAILDASLHSFPFYATGPLTVASSDQSAEPPDIISPPLLTSEGTTPADSVHLVPTPPSQDAIHLGFMPDEVQELNTSTVSPGGVEERHSSHATHTTSIKRLAPSEFNESINASSERASNRPPIPSTQEELAWTQQNPNSALVHECENRGPGIPATCLPAVQEETEPEPENIPTRQMTVAEVEDEMKAPRGFISFIRYGLTKSRLSVQSMISASGTIRSRFSSRRSSQQSIMASEQPEDTNPFLYASYMSNRDQTLSAILPPQPMNYEGGRQATSLFLELRLAGTTDDNVARRLKGLLQDVGPAKARTIVNARNASRETALEVALALGNVPACRVLLDAGADVHARTSNGKSLSEFGRKAQSEANNNLQYIAIGSCRNVIFSHFRSKKGSKSRKADIVKTDSTPHTSGQIAAERGLVLVEQRHSDTITTESPHSVTTLQGDANQEEVWAPVFDDTTQQQSVSGGMKLAEDETTSGSNLTSTSAAVSASHFPTTAPISSQQTLTPAVPDLIAFFESVGPADSARWQHQAFHPFTPNTSQRMRPETLIWNSYFMPSQGLPSSAPLGGGSGTLDMSSIAGSGFSAPGIGGSGLTSSTHSGRYEVLPDGRVAYILPFNQPSLPRAASSLDRHFSHRDARVFDMGNSVQLQVPMTTQMNSSRPIMQHLMDQQPVFGSSINPYAHLANESAYSNSVLQQQQYLLNTNFADANNLSNPPPTSNTYDFGANYLLGSPGAPFNDNTTLQSNNLIPNPPNQQLRLSDTEIEALSLHFTLTTSDDPSSYGNNFVQDWDSLPTGS